MNLAIATNVSVFGKGGLEVLVCALASGLSGRHRITLISKDQESAVSNSNLAGCLVDFVSLPSSPNQTCSPRWLAEQLCTRGIDTCHFHIPGTYGWHSASLKLAPMPALKKAGIRCFTTNHQAVSPFDLTRANESALRLCASYVRKLPAKSACLRAVQKEILVSDHDLHLSRRMFPHHQGKFCRIYHSLLDEPDTAAGLAGTKTILNLATVCFRKGQHVLVDAFCTLARDFPDWRLRIVGTLAETACIEMIRKRIRDQRLEDRIEMTGPSADPSGELSRAEIYVQPSLLEGLGLSLQEALFHGIPTIGSRIGGIPELVDDGECGFLADAGDVRSLADKMRLLMSDRSLRVRMGAAGIGCISAKGMTRSSMLESYADLYQSA